MRLATQCFIAANVVVLHANCGDDQTATDSTASSSTSGDGSSTEPNSSTSSGIPTTGEPSAFPCEEAVYPIDGVPLEVVEMPMEMINPAVFCPTLMPNLSALEVYVYRPDPLPTVPLPFALLTNGAAGQQAMRYRHVLEPLVERGFIAVAVQSDFEVNRREDVMKCTLRWLRMKWGTDNGVNPSCDLVLMGHSRGGEAAWNVGNTLENIPWTDINLDGVDIRLRALVGLAPRFQTSTAFSPLAAVPYFGIMGATDDDVPGNGIRAYDNMILESERTSSDPAKVFFWPYDVPHGAFGGGGLLFLPDGSPLSAQDYTEKAHALISAFLPPFIDIYVLGDPSDIDVLSGVQIPSALTPGGNTNWWSYIEPAFSELGGGPIVLRDFVVGQTMQPGARTRLDDFEGAIEFSTTMTQVAVDTQFSFALGTKASGNHAEHVMRVRWGGPDPGGEITWELDSGAGFDLSEHSFFSLRIGQELILDGQSCGFAPGDPHAEALELVIRLEDDLANISEVPLGPIVQQSVQLGPGGCKPDHFMQTLRLPMSAFCEAAGFDISSVVSLTIEFPTLTHNVGAFIDTMEFSRHNLDDAGLCS